MKKGRITERQRLALNHIEIIMDELVDMANYLPHSKQEQYLDLLNELSDKLSELGI